MPLNHGFGVIVTFRLFIIIWLVYNKIMLKKKRLTISQKIISSFLIFTHLVLVRL